MSMVEIKLNLEEDSAFMEMKKSMQRLEKQCERDCNYLIARLDTHIARIAEVEQKNVALNDIVDKQQKRIEYLENKVGFAEWDKKVQASCAKEPPKEKKEEGLTTHYYRVLGSDGINVQGGCVLTLKEVAQLPLACGNYQLTYAYSTVIENNSAYCRDLLLKRF